MTKRKLHVWNKREGKMTDAKVLKPMRSAKNDTVETSANSKISIFAKAFSEKIKNAAK